MNRSYASTPEGLVHCYIEGSGDPIVLLGSAGRSARMFEELIGALSDRYTAIGLDVLGSGGSDALPAGAGMRTLADNVIHVLDALELESAHLFGLHTGNKIATATAAAYPHRVRTFVLCGQTHSIVPDREERNKGIGDRAKTYQADLGTAQSQLIAWAMLSQRISDLWWGGDGFSDGHVEAAVRHNKTVAIDDLQSFESVPHMYSLNFHYDMAADWPRIQTPTLVLEITTPRETTLYGPQGQSVVELIPGSRLATLESTGYKNTFEDRADELAEIISAFCQ